MQTEEIEVNQDTEGIQPTSSSSSFSSSYSEGKVSQQALNGAHLTIAQFPFCFFSPFLSPNKCVAQTEVRVINRRVHLSWSHVSLTLTQREGETDIFFHGGAEGWGFTSGRGRIKEKKRGSNS